MPPKELPKGEKKEEEVIEKPPKKSSRFKIIAIFLSLMIVLGGIGGAAYYWLYMRPNATGLAGLLDLVNSKDEPVVNNTTSQDANVVPTDVKKDAPKDAKDTPASTAKISGKNAPKALPKPVSLPSMTVNLSDTDANRYLKIDMDVEFNTADAAQIVEKESARVRDAIILLLSSKTARDLLSSEGKVMLKNEVANRLNQIIGTAQVVRVYFTNFVIE